MSPNPKPLEAGARRKRVPSATYRLQFHPDFTFQHGEAIADYLCALGISDCYASPLFRSGPQSTHGYDICGFEELNPALGGTAGFDRFVARLQERGLGLLLDMVPNHMGNDLSNSWWNDVLEHGRASAFALFFDIDWEPAGLGLRNQVLLPTLEDHYAKVLEDGRLQLVFKEGGFFVKYHDRHFPLAPHSYAEILEAVAAAAPAYERPGDASRRARRLVQELRERDPATGSVAESIGQLKAQIQAWAQNSFSFAESWKLVQDKYNGHAGKPRSFDALDGLLRQQHYRLAYWRVGSEEINYRRFFDVTSLVSIRMELPLVFQATHQLIFQLIRAGKINGLRIDHPDGLWDPKEYFTRLQSGYLAAHASRGADQAINVLEPAASDWLMEQLAPLEVELLQEDPDHPESARARNPLLERSGSPIWPLYVVVEKILSPGEPLRRDWPVDGTTGYNFLNQVNGVFVHPTHREWLDSIYREFTGSESSIENISYRSKEQMLRTSLASELNALTHRLKQVAVRSRYGLDYTLGQIQSALAAIIAAFPVYRTYVTTESQEAIPRERLYIERAVSEAMTRNPKAEAGLYRFIRDLLLLRWPDDFDEEAVEEGRVFIMKFQQVTGPVMAKGLEDTSFYRYNRLISLNEVGGEPGRFGVSVEAFHQHNVAQAQAWPHSLLATATHDTKRGEDARARINTLSEIPQTWQAAVQRWSKWNAAIKLTVAGVPAPDPNDEYLLYQTLIGAWPVTPSLAGPEPPTGNSGASVGPLWQSAPTHAAEEPAPKSTAAPTFQDRIVDYLRKATREAKTHTTWTDPNQAYEEATTKFAESLLDPTVSNTFLKDFALLQLQAAYFGELNSLSQVLLKCTCPGVPDFYQGSELWDLSLVDPDNRRPVDYDLRRRLLKTLEDGLKNSDRASLLHELLAGSSSGLVKLFVIQQCLQFRQQRRQLFDQGAYVPLAVSGRHQEHVCAFARSVDQETVVVAVPRLVCTLTSGMARLPLTEKVWADTSISVGSVAGARQFKNLFTNETVSPRAVEGQNSLRMSEILKLFPVALLYTA